MHVKHKKRAASIAKIHGKETVYVDKAGKVYLTKPSGIETEAHKPEKKSKTTKKVNNG